MNEPGSDTEALKEGGTESGSAGRRYFAQRRLGLLLGIVALSLLVAGILLAVDLQGRSGDLQRAYSSAARGLDLLSQIDSQSRETHESVLLALFTEDPDVQIGYADRSKAAETAASQSLEELASLLEPLEAQASVAELKATWATYLALRDEVLGLILEEDIGRAHRVDSEQTRPLFTAFRQSLTRYRQIFETKTEAELDSVRSSLASAVLRIAFILACALVLAFFAIHYFRKAQRLNGVLVQSVIDLKQTESRLRESEERYALAAQGTNDGIWDWNLVTDVVYYSPRWKSMLAYGEDEIRHEKREWLERVHPADRRPLDSGLSAHIAGTSKLFECEYRILHRDGSYRWMLGRAVAVVDAEGKTTRLAGSQSDITKRKHAEEQLLHDAMHDSLTGLPNRNLFLDRLRHARSRVARSSQGLFAVLFIDLDRFKLVNDSLGHLVGDQFLVEIARRLEKQLRVGDTLARFGGDEFAVLLEDLTDEAQGIALARRLQEGLTPAIRINDRDLFASASIGIVCSSASGPSEEDLLRFADAAMYQAKTGKIGLKVFDSAAHQTVMQSFEVEHALRSALEKGEFTVYYQPIISAGERRIAGVEALMRWRKQGHGLISPDEFIPVAEDIGFITKLTDWLLVEACAQARRWNRGAEPLYLSVNVSTRHFEDRSLLESVKSALELTGLRPDLLQLELTETALLRNAEMAGELLRELNKLGVRLALDDFGTGYSSLNYLTSFPFDCVKIDRRFVSECNRNPRRAQIVKAVANLAENLGISVTAEGIEDDEDGKYCQSVGCSSLQGFLFGHPEPAQKIDELMGLQPASESPGSDPEAQPVADVRRTLVEG